MNSSQQPAKKNTSFLQPQGNRFANNLNKVGSESFPGPPNWSPAGSHLDFDLLRPLGEYLGERSPDFWPRELQENKWMF